MIFVNTSRRPLNNQEAGFALIASLSIMAFLVLIAVALYSLSSVATKSAAIAAARTEAQANAKMALMIAIGDLQKHTGADTRVTAPADIIDDNAPKLVGAWRSWEGLNHNLTDPADPTNPTGRPIAPDYTIKDTTNTTADARFLSWLISGDKVDAGGNPVSPFDLVSDEAATDGSTIPLLAEGSLLSTATEQIHLAPTPMEGKGHYAWWVSPENQKARLAQPYAPRADDAAGWVEMGQSHSAPNLEVFFGQNSDVNELEPYSPSAGDTGSTNKALNRATLALIDSEDTEPEKRFHDFSTSAVGLLTNTATGGWRKDMSLLTEKWDDIYSSFPGGELPLFRYSPISGATSQVPKPSTSNYDPEQSNLYPWSEYSLILGYKQAGTYHAASASWASLQSFATSYKNFSYSSGVAKSPFAWDKIAKRRETSITSEEIYNHKHLQRLHPQIARFRMLVYAKAIEDPNRLNQDPKRYQLRLMYVPFFTLWNPYNVSIEKEISGTLNGGQNSGTHTNFLGIGMRRSLPGAMAIVDQNSYLAPDLVPDSQYRLLTNGNFQTQDWPGNYANPYDNELPGNLAKFGSKSTWKDLRSWACWLPEGTLTFQPGEAKIFSPEWLDTGYGFGGGAFRMREGYDPTDIVGRDFDSSSNLLATKSFWFLFRNDRLTQPYRDRAPGYGFTLSFGDGGSHFGGTAVLPSGIGDEFHNLTALANESEGDKYWPPDEVDEVGYSVAELASGPWIPLFSMSFGPRTTIGTGPGTQQNRPTKGFVQNNALAAMVLSEPDSGVAKDHPANNTFDFAYHSLSIGSTITPNLSESEGYIATGYQSGDGLSRLIVSEIPVRPMASLVELQGWNPRGHNPYPPFQMNLIGNSDATPLIPKDDVVPPTLSPSDTEFNLQHDDAYCANHLLFDDWFVSSIAPKPQNLGGTIDRTIEQVYEGFLQGDNLLSNRAYQPIAKDQNLASSDAAMLADSIINSSGGDGWLKVASRLEVAGMFNINSTSVDAWKAILGHAKSREEIALYGESGAESTNPTGSHPITRGAAAFDVEAGSSPAIGGEFDNASEFTGFRSLSDAQIADLAQKIVEQIRLRGPFLSLSEFVNRQLNSDEDLALAGTVQTAINNLSDDPMAALRDPLNSLSDDTMDVADPKVADADYEFERAAEGSSAYGAPGWIRQADILRPIAPILSARDDTFTIRAYGDTLDKGGKVLARVWCEATVKRTRDFCDPADSADSIEPPASATNADFGRKYEIVAFRWLDPDEV